MRGSEKGGMRRELGEGKTAAEAGVGLGGGGSGLGKTPRVTSGKWD